MFYEQRLGDNYLRIVEIVKWNDDEVMLRDLRTDELYVMFWDSFFPYHKELVYECEEDKETTGSRFGELLKSLK